MPLLEQSFCITMVLATGILIWVVATCPEKFAKLRDAVIWVYSLTWGSFLGLKLLFTAYANIMTIVRFGLWGGIIGVSLVALVLLRDRRHALAFGLGWLLPGLGHFFLGRRNKALLFLGSILGLYLMGLLITSFRTVGFDDNPYYYVGKFGCGVTVLFSWLLGPEKPFPGETTAMLWFDPGLLYAGVAGLLNLVVALNVFEVPLPEAGKEPAPEPQSGEAPSPVPEVEA